MIGLICLLILLIKMRNPIHLISVLGVLWTQETSCIVITGLLKRDSFDLLLPEFDKPLVIHLRKTCCCSTNLCTWKPNTVYKNRSVRRHQRTGYPEKYWNPIFVSPKCGKTLGYARYRIQARGLEFEVGNKFLLKQLTGLLIRQEC
jgi:hypothetical protein